MLGLRVILSSAPPNDSFLAGFRLGRGGGSGVEIDGDGVSLGDNAVSVLADVGGLRGDKGLDVARERGGPLAQADLKERVDAGDDDGGCVRLMPDLLIAW